MAGKPDGSRGRKVLKKAVPSFLPPPSSISSPQLRNQQQRRRDKGTPRCPPPLPLLWQRTSRSEGRCQFLLFYFLHLICLPYGNLLFFLRGNRPYDNERTWQRQRAWLWRGRERLYTHLHRLVRSLRRDPAATFVLASIHVSLPARTLAWSIDRNATSGFTPANIGVTHVISPRNREQDGYETV